MRQRLLTAEELGAAIRARRAELGMRQVDLAAAAGTTTRLVSEIENGKETAQLDGVLNLLRKLGLDLYVETR